jgi:hypothetical protein
MGQRDRKPLSEPAIPPALVVRFGTRRLPPVVLGTIEMAMFFRISQCHAA